MKRSPLNYFSIHLRFESVSCQFRHVFVDGSPCLCDWILSTSISHMNGRSPIGQFFATIVCADGKIRNVLQSICGATVYSTRQWHRIRDSNTYRDDVCRKQDSGPNDIFISMHLYVSMMNTLVDFSMANNATILLIFDKSRKKQ